MNYSTETVYHHLLAADGKINEWLLADVCEPIPQSEFWHIVLSTLKCGGGFGRAKQLVPCCAELLRMHVLHISMHDKLALEDRGVQWRYVKWSKIAAPMLDEMESYLRAWPHDAPAPQMEAIMEERAFH